MKMWPLIAGAGSAALLVGLVLFEFTGGASASAPTVSDLTQVALTVSARNGVTAPTNIEYVTTTRKAANLLLAGASVDSDESVTVFQMTGPFTGYGASVPMGANLPTGTVLTVIIDSATGRVSDWGIGPSTMATLAHLGNPVQVHPSPQATSATP
jgi:hypothetical protein